MSKSNIFTPYTSPSTTVSTTSSPSATITTTTAHPAFGGNFIFGGLPHNPAWKHPDRKLIGGVGKIHRMRTSKKYEIEEVIGDTEYPYYVSENHVYLGKGAIPSPDELRDLISKYDGVILDAGSEIFFQLYDGVYAQILSYMLYAIPSSSIIFPDGIQRSNHRHYLGMDRDNAVYFRPEPPIDSDLGIIPPWSRKKVKNYKLNNIPIYDMKGSI